MEDDRGQVQTQEHVAQALAAPALEAARCEGAPIARVAGRLSDVVASGGTVYTFGAGHSSAFAAELCSRAGGLHSYVSMNLDDLRSTPRRAHHQLTDSAPERAPANGPALITTFGVSADDALLIASQSGRNGASVEMARHARARGTYTAAVLSLRHCAAVRSRHPDGLRLTDVVDDVIDNHCPLGDATVSVGDGLRMGAASTVAFAMIAQLLNVAVGQELLARGLPLDVITSANVDVTEG